MCAYCWQRHNDGNDQFEVCVMVLGVDACPLCAAEGCPRDVSERRELCARHRSVQRQPIDVQAPSLHHCVRAPMRAGRPISRAYELIICRAGFDNDGDRRAYAY